MSVDNFSRQIIVKVPLTALDTGGGVLSWQNPETVPIAVTKLEIDTLIKSIAASTVDAGTTVASATTSSNNLLTGLDTGTAIGLFNNTDDKGASGKSHQRLAVGGWITISKASGACAGLVGYAYVFYMKLSL